MDENIDNSKSTNTSPGTGSQEEAMTTSGNKLPKKPPFSNRRLVYVLSVIIVVGFCVAAFLLWRHYKSGSMPHQTYTQTTVRHLSGPSSGKGMSFQSPVELVATDVPTSTTISLNQLAPNNNPPASVASIDAEVSPLTNPLNSVNLSVVTATLMGSTTTDAYKAVTTPLVHFLQPRGSVNHSLTLGTAQPFTNKSIQNYAWVFDFKLSAKNPNAKNLSDRTTYDGKLVYAFGQQTAYYFAITDVDHNWQGDQATWKNVLDSLKIDQ